MVQITLIDLARLRTATITANAPQIKQSRARSDIVVDQQYLEATGLQQGQTSVDGRFPAIQPVSPQPANDASVNNQLSLSRTSNTSMTNSQSMQYCQINVKTISLFKQNKCQFTSIFLFSISISKHIYF